MGYRKEWHNMYLLESGTQPNKYQRAQMKRRFGMFIHFGINTFADCEWSDGTLAPALYAPSEINCDEWAKTAAEAGMRYVIITAKHHDGFCMWETRTTEYCIRNSGNSEDVISKLRKACDKYGLELGIYYSLWDRNSEVYKNNFKNGYLPYMRTQLEELLRNYGDICELWLDGSWDKPAAEWEFPELYDMVKKINPACQIGINHTIGRSTPEPEERYKPENCVEGDPIRMFPSDFRLWDPYPCSERDPKIYTYNGQKYYLPFEMTICSREGFSWFNSSEYETKPFLNREKTVKDCITAFRQKNNVVINMPPDINGRLSKGDVRQLKEIAKEVRVYVGTDYDKEQ